ncbi:SCO-spondin-like isoform X2 [Ruditapes philippinarum]|nr:SCO-spondin-like isoform X2 [Ruditapes philippinarum]
MNITDCRNDEVCYARADGTSSGKVKYTVGCTRDMSAQREDATFCTNMCLENLCNLNHCNIPISPKGGKVRPPRCMSCELISSPDTCTNLVQCNENEICYIREVVVYGNKRFRMGCMSTIHCTRSTPDSINPGIIVGKRSNVAHNTSTACSVCCDKDNCNTVACEHHTSSVGTIYALQMFGDPSCFNKNEDSCASFGMLDTNACVKVPKVDQLCPKTCGLCGHYGWSQWHDWSDCSKTCSQGTAVRRRDCLYQVHVAHAQNCTGISIETKTCSDRLCLHEGVWSNWGSWGQCSSTCSYATKSRVRYCSGSGQIHGNLFCPGDHFDISQCNLLDCPVCPSSSWVYKRPSCYLFIRQKMTFDAAQKTCHGRNASLVHVQSTVENSFVVSYLKSHNDSDTGWWLGMTDSVTEGNWEWSDLNQKVNFTFWNDKQPDNDGAYGAENCAVFLAEFQYKWNDIACNRTYNVICKRT